LIRPGRRIETYTLNSQRSSFRGIRTKRIGKRELWSLLLSRGTKVYTLQSREAATAGYQPGVMT
jgi:hypothetical protein